MTSNDVRRRIGARVTENAVCEIGVIKSLNEIPGGTHGGVSRRREYTVTVSYPTAERVVPISSLRFATSHPVPTVPVAAGINHNEFLKRMRSLYYSCPTVDCGTPKEIQDEDEAYSYVFALVFGRKPTAAELHFMTGGDFGRCERCGKTRKPEFFRDGTYGTTCECTESISQSFASLIEPIKRLP